MKNINIQRESAEFLNLQIHGQCCEECRNRLTKVNIPQKTKDLLKPIWCYLYFGYEVLSFSKEQLNELKKVFKKLSKEVSMKEKNLINYISLRVAGSNDNKIFANLQRYYNKSSI